MANYSTLANDFGNLLRDGDEFCDGTIVCADGTSIRVHKLVLSARSSYFKSSFYGELASDTITLPSFEADVLLAVKKYCYTDLVDTINSASYDHSILREVDFLVRLTMAADYIMLRKLQRVLWDRAYSKMNFVPKRHITIPAMFSNAKAMNVEGIMILAWHSYWTYQQQRERFTWMEAIDSKDVVFEDNALPSNVDYKGIGMILVLGCSEEHINGEYYGVDEFYNDLDNKHTFFKKTKDEAESLGIMVIRDDDFEDWVSLEYHYELGEYEEEEGLCDGEATTYHGEVKYRTTLWKKKGAPTTTGREWEMGHFHQQQVGEQMVPMSFIFKF